MEAMLACHSRGPVGISDGPGQTDSDLVRRIITHRGTILQPSRAMMAIDASYAKNKSRRPDGEVWASRTVLPLTGVSGHEFCTTHFVLAVGNEDSTGKGYTLRRGVSSSMQGRHISSDAGLQIPRTAALRKQQRPTALRPGLHVLVRHIYPFRHKIRVTAQFGTTPLHLLHMSSGAFTQCWATASRCLVSSTNLSV